MNEEVQIPADSGSVRLNAFLNVPDAIGGTIVFAHGSGSSRHSSRNQYVARLLNETGFATLLLDLLTPDEERVDAGTREYRFDIPMLARRVAEAARWTLTNQTTAHRPVGLFGASTGAAAALIASVELEGKVSAVVSRGGRPDLADQYLESVKAPTLLIVGSLDDVVIELNREALARIPGPKELKIINGASHLFEESGTLDQAATAATKWFQAHLR